MVYRPRAVIVFEMTGFAETFVNMPLNMPIVGGSVWDFAAEMIDAFLSESVDGYQAGW